MAAPWPGSGAYSAHEITQVPRTAVAGFTAARLEVGGEVTMHTGFWGCGAFGGNRVLMTALQVVAARLAEVARLAYWTGANPTDEAAFSHGCDLADRLLDGARSATAIVERAAAASVPLPSAREW